MDDKTTQIRQLQDALFYLSRAVEKTAITCPLADANIINAAQQRAKDALAAHDRWKSSQVPE